jgi:uncharacterized protein (TIGR03067 family)
MRRAAFVLLATLTALVAGCGKKPGPQSGPEGSTPQGGESDQEKLQGVWAVEKLDAGDPKLSPSTEVVQKMRVHFDGTKVWMDGRLRYSMVLDTASNPKVMIVNRLNEDGQPEQFGGEKGQVERNEWLYKFDGEILVLAVVLGKAKRPTNFTPQPSSGRLDIVGTPGKGVPTVNEDNYVPAVSILRLKKTNEAPPIPKPRPSLPQGTRPKGK